MNKKEIATEAAKSFDKTRSKDNHFSNQCKIVYQSFMERPKTMLQVSIETGILRANICRYVEKMEKEGQIQIVRKGLCPLTHCRAGFYSTDKALFTKPNVVQLNLFENGI
ncbi:MAG: hypothetical protein LBT24_01880 [Tannerella sp.]|jgi:hypothetical protein|nr:hypothetical protein [Tannerella sp.]